MSSIIINTQHSTSTDTYQQPLPHPPTHHQFRDYTMAQYRFYLVFLKGNRPDAFWIVDDNGFAECYRIRINVYGKVELYAAEIAVVTDIPHYQSHEYFEALNIHGLRDLLDLIEELLQEMNMSENPADRVTQDWVAGVMGAFFRDRHLDRVNQ